jgi:hypothetical protein
VDHRGAARGAGRAGASHVTGEVVVSLGPYVKVRLDVGAERWAKLRPGSSAPPGQRVRLLHEGDAWPVAAPFAGNVAPRAP